MLPLGILFGCSPPPPAIPAVNDPHNDPDYDGDGYADIAIATTRDAEDRGNDGWAVFYGSPNGPGAPQTWTSEADAVSGTAVHFVGDVDGDGFSDLAFHHEAEQGGSSEVWLYHGGPEGLSPTFDTLPAPLLPQPDASEAVGTTVRWAGDLDGDDLDDLVVVRVRSVSVHYGAGGVGGAPDVVFDAKDMPAWFEDPDPDSPFHGFDIAGAVGLGDVTGDGRDDLLIHYAVEAYPPYFVCAGPCAPDQPWIPLSEIFPAIEHDNSPILHAGEFDGDGIPDLIGGEGVPSLLLSSEAWATATPLGVDNLACVNPHTTTVDTDGDGLHDLVAGCTPTVDDIAHGRDTAWEVQRLTPALVTAVEQPFPHATGALPDEILAQDPQMGWRFGRMARGVSDVDGDGYDDFALSVDVTGPWVFYGGPKGARRGDPGVWLRLESGEVTLPDWAYPPGDGRP